MSEDNREGRVAGARDGKTMIGAYVTKDTLYTLARSNGTLRIYA